MTSSNYFPPIMPALRYPADSFSLGIGRVLYEQIGQIPCMPRLQEDTNQTIRIGFRLGMGYYNFVGVTGPVYFQKSGYSVHPQHPSSRGSGV